NSCSVRRPYLELPHHTRVLEGDRVRTPGSGPFPLEPAVATRRRDLRQPVNKTGVATTATPVVPSLDLRLPERRPGVHPLGPPTSRSQSTMEGCPAARTGSR